MFIHPVHFIFIDARSQIGIHTNFVPCSADLKMHVKKLAISSSKTAFSGIIPRRIDANIFEKHDKDKTQKNFVNYKTPSPPQIIQNLATFAWRTLAH